MRANEEVYERSKRKEEDSIDVLSSYDYSVRVTKVASQYRNGEACKVLERFKGAFNFCFRLHFQRGTDWILRLPIPGCTMNPIRKTQNEIAVMAFLTDKTTIPTPKVIAYDLHEADLDHLGPYILMEYVDGRTLDDLFLIGDTWKLDKNIPSPIVEKVYRQIAKYYLQLFAYSFPKIGALSMSDESDRTWSITSGPLTFKMNEMERMGGLKEPVSDVPIDLTKIYFDMLIRQSLLLHNNEQTGRSEEESRLDDRCIRTLQALSNHFAASDSNQQFRLFCDDLRFGNILVNEGYDIVAILDWEFTYIAPGSFLSSPPSFLIGEDPFEWSKDELKDWQAKSKRFIDIVEEEESSRGLQNTLSCQMRQAKLDGTFWYNLAIREAFPVAETMKFCWDWKPFSRCDTPDGKGSQ